MSLPRTPRCSQAHREILGSPVTNRSAQRQYHWYQSINPSISCSILPSPDPEWALHPFPADNYGLRLVLILVPVTSHSAANCLNAHWRLSPDEPRRTMSSAYSSDMIPRVAKWKPSAAWLQLELCTMWTNLLARLYRNCRQVQFKEHTFSTFPKPLSCALQFAVSIYTHNTLTWSTILELSSSETHFI